MSYRKVLIFFVASPLLVANFAIAVYLAIAYEHHWPHIHDLPETSLSPILRKVGLLNTPDPFLASITPMGELDAVLIHKDNSE
jgi:hypothetical protein